MTSKLSIIFFIAMVATVLHSSTAQTTHVVGASLGWTIPPGGAVDYTTWASQQTFVHDDILVFYFSTGYHNVAEVSKTSYDACKITESPISILTNGPTSITLNSVGEHYYICTFPSHCDAGMKLAINVSVAATASPPESTPSSPAPVPSPSRNPLSDGAPSGGIAPTGGFVPLSPSSNSTSKFVATIPVSLIVYYIYLKYYKN